MKVPDRTNDVFQKAGLIAVLALLAAIWLQWPSFSNQWLVQNDARIHIWWMEQFRDPELFQHDALAEMMKSKSLRNIGFTALFKFLSQFVSPMYLTKILSILLLPLTCLMIFLAGNRMAGKTAGVTASLLYGCLSLTSGSSGLSVLDGLQRSFRDPILMIGLYGIVAKNRTVILLSTGASLLFYPIAAPVIIGTLCVNTFFFDREWVNRNRKTIKIVVLSFLVVSLTAILVAGFFYSDKSFYGFQGSLLSNPRFGPNGREPAFHTERQWLGIPEYVFIGKSVGLFGFDITEATGILILTWIAVGIVFIGSFRKSPRVLAAFLTSGLIGYAASWLFALVTNRFLLYFPSRYNTLMLFLIILTGCLCAHVRPWTICSRIVWILWLLTPVAFLHGTRSQWMYLTPALLAVAGVIPERILTRQRLLPILMIAAFLVPRLTRMERTPGAVEPEPWEKQLIQQLHQTPVSTVVAGPPDMMNNIPIHAHRSVYLNFEMDTEMRTDWARERFTRFFGAYFAETFSEVLDFAERENIDLMLIDTRLFDSRFLDACRSGVTRVYLEPHNKTILDGIGVRKQFALANPPPDRIEFEYGPLVLLRLKQ